LHTEQLDPASLHRDILSFYRELHGVDYPFHYVRTSSGVLSVYKRVAIALLVTSYINQEGWVEYYFKNVSSLSYLHAPNIVNIFG
jgi:hypothetical protein